VEATAPFFSSYAGIYKSGTPQPSLDVDANRLVLLDCTENGYSGHSEDTADNPYLASDVDWEVARRYRLPH